MKAPKIRFLSDDVNYVHKTVQNFDIPEAVLIVLQGCKLTLAYNLQNRKNCLPASV